MPRSSLAAVVFEPLRAASGIFQDQDAAVSEGDFFGLPSGGLAARIQRDCPYAISDGE
jgi:hypothetical protein